MRQTPMPDEEPDLFVRSLAIDYVAGCCESDHSHPWPQFLYACSGAIRAETNGKWWTIPPRRGLWIPSGTKHSLHMSSRMQLRTLYFSPVATSTHAEINVVDVSGLLHEAILRVCELGYLDARNQADRSLGAIILGELERHDPAAISLNLPVDPRARKLADMFLGDELRDRDLNVLCAAAGLSRRTAERLFLKEVGLPPAQWRRFALLSESLVSIAGGERIENAGLSAGYQSRSAFSEAFSRTFGIAPSGVR
jgi:AraC-like DNA-binding protein